MGVGVERLAGARALGGRRTAASFGPLAGALGGRAVAAGLVAGAVAAVAVAWAWSQASAATSAVPSVEMGRLLRFMALVKAVVPAAALYGLLRRVRRPIGAGRLAAYACGLWTCAAGPALIAQLGHVGLGAVLFHGGWIVMAAAAWRDAGLVARRWL